MAGSIEDFIEKLVAVVGEQGIICDPLAQRSYTEDWLGRWSGVTPVVVRPENTTQVAAVIKLCHQTHTPVVTQGGNTSLSGGATPDQSGAQVLLSTVRMNRIREVDPLNNTISVDAGVLLANVQAAATQVERLFPLSLAAEGSCTIGGNLATNAGGVSVLQYGNMRALTLGLEVVLPDGRIWSGLRGLRKDNTGYDLRDIFVGSEGTLGVITGAVLKLFPARTARGAAWIGTDSLEALMQVFSLTQERCGERLTAFEMISATCLDLVVEHMPECRAPLASTSPYNALIELSDTGSAGLQELLEQTLEIALERSLVDDAVLASSEAQRAALWRIRESISEAQSKAGQVIKHDIPLPLSSLSGFVAAAEAALASSTDIARIGNFGHLGDGNLHFNLLLPLTTTAQALEEQTTLFNRIVHDLVFQHGGSISAEHGIGQLRRKEMKRYKSDLELELMMRIKRAFDPNHLMNPGKLI